MYNWHALSFLMERAKENQAPCPGVWANEKTPEECKNTLREVLEEWLLLELLDNDPLPELDGISLKVVEES
jgi:predicted RNase H-like HicB family nuclease